MTVLLAVAAAALPGVVVAPDPAPPYWRQRGCTYRHESQRARNKIRQMLLSHDPYPHWRQAHHLAVCVDTRAKARAGLRAVRHARRWRLQYAHVWPIRLNRQPAGWRGWAWATSGCESNHGHNPRTNLNGFRGRFQWLVSTWLEANRRVVATYGRAPTVGDPAYASYEHEAVAAIMLARTDSTGHWPNCG